MITDASSDTESLPLGFSQPQRGTSHETGDSDRQFSAELLRDTEESDIEGVGDVFMCGEVGSNIRDLDDHSEVGDDEMEDSEESDHEQVEPEGPADLDPGGDWHPFRNRVSAQLILLYHGSHRRNCDLVTFRAFMTILKVRTSFLVKDSHKLIFLVPY